MTDKAWLITAVSGWAFLAGWWACYFIITKKYKDICKGQSGLINESIDINCKLLRINNELLRRMEGEEWKEDEDG
jgi:hypothetical protein